MSSYKFLISTFLVLCVVGIGQTKKQIPDYIQVCKRDQSTISDCVKKSIEALRPNLIAGIPELHVPSLEPFVIPELVASSGDRVPLYASGKNIKVSGAGDFILKNLKVDLDKFFIEADLRFPKLHFEGRYKLDTQILVVPLKGEGDLLIDAVKVDGTIHLRGKLSKKDGVEFLSFESSDVKFALKDYSVQLSGLFNNDKVLGQAANDAINQNKEEFLNVLRPYLESTVAKLLKDIANKVVDDLAFDDLLPKP